jgi:ribosomal protein S18 acetylase RimI-like enzyme
MEFRYAVPSYIPQLIGIRLAYLSEDYHGLSDNQEKTIRNQLSEYLGNHLGKDLFVYIGEDLTDIVSTVFLLLIEKPANPSFLTGKTGIILNVYTKPDYRRQGVAGTLIKMAIEAAKEMRLSFLELSATADGLLLYKKLGFASEATRYTNLKLLL